MTYFNGEPYVPRVRYQARCSFGAAVGMSSNSSCGKLVGRGHMLCCDHESAEAIETGIDVWTLVRTASTVGSWASALAVAVGTELAMIALTVVR